MWSDTPTCAVPTQQVRSQIVNGAAALAQLVSDLGSDHQATGWLMAIPKLQVGVGEAPVSTPT